MRCIRVILPNSFFSLFFSFLQVLVFKDGAIGFVIVHHS